MDKGINTTIETTRKELENLINEKLKMGLPISVVSLIVESVLMEIRNNVDVVLQQESNRYAEQLNTQEEQVEWKDSE